MNAFNSHFVKSLLVFVKYQLIRGNECGSSSLSQHCEMRMKETFLRPKGREKKSQINCQIYNACAVSPMQM